MYIPQRIRRSAISRLLALVLFAASCYVILGKSTTEASSLNSNIAHLKAAIHKPTRDAGGGRSQSLATTFEQTSFTHRTLRADGHVKLQKWSHPPMDKAPSGVEKPVPQSVLSETTGGINAKQISEALAMVEDLLLEVHQLQDLSPIEADTGEKRLRRSGLKSRVLGKALHIWERIHFHDQDHRIRLRRNIVEMIRDGTVDHQSPADGAHLIHLYEALEQLLNSLSIALFPYFRDDLVALHANFKYAGRGIVMTAGNDQARYLMTTIPTFRTLGCTLPIEIMYLGEDDLSVTNQDTLKRLPGVVIRDLTPMVNSKGWSFTAWSAKPFAILLSSFREVLFIDADSFFFVNPESLFSDPGYISTGALFFQDRNEFPDATHRSFLESALPPPVSEKAKQSRFWIGDAQHMQESGVIVVDKWRHFVSMLLITRMNGPDRDTDEQTGAKGFYDMFYGDKETFWLGFELAGDTNYTFHPGRCSIMGAHERHASPTGRALQLDILGYDDAELDNSIGLQFDGFVICSSQLVHLDTRGRPLWFNGWISKNKYSGQRKFADFKSFIVESTRDELPEAWDLGRDNVGCLRGNSVFEFSTTEQAVLDMIMATARGNPALDMVT